MAASTGAENRPISRPPITNTGAPVASERTAAARPWSVSTAGYMPRARARSSSTASSISVLIDASLLPTSYSADSWAI